MEVVSRDRVEGDRGLIYQCIGSVPCVERLEELETVGGGRDGDADGGALRGRSLVSVCGKISRSTMTVSSGVTNPCLRGKSVK